MHDETQLVEAARTDRQAFGVLYDRYFDAIYNYIARRVGDHQTAEDLTGATWVRALGAIQQYQMRGLPFAAWLYRIAGNVVANHHRQGALRHDSPLELASGQVAPNHDDRIHRDDAVATAIAALSETDQELIGLCYFAGLSPQEIGDIVGCSQQAVHKRLHRARARLKAQLESADDG